MQPSIAHAFEHTNGLRSLAYRLLGESHPESADRYHRSQDSYLAVSPLYGPDESGHRSFELTVLTDSLVAPLMAGISGFQSLQPEVMLGRERFRFRPTETVVQHSFEQIWECPLPAGMEFRFQFFTPTATHVTTRGTGRKINPLPDPSRLYPSWLRRWNRHAPKTLHFLEQERFFEIVDRQVAVSELNGHTTEIQLFDRSRERPRLVIGFVGYTTFRVLAPAALELRERRLVAALSRYADYCGTGVETMRGLGQTRLLGER